MRHAISCGMVVSEIFSPAAEEASFHVSMSRSRYQFPPQSPAILNCASVQGFAARRCKHEQRSHKTVENGKVKLSRHDSRLSNCKSDLLLVVPTLGDSRAVSNQFADTSSRPS